VSCLRGGSLRGGSSQQLGAPADGPRVWLVVGAASALHLPAGSGPELCAGRVSAEASVAQRNSLGGLLAGAGVVAVQSQGVTHTALCLLGVRQQVCVTGVKSVCAFVRFSASAPAPLCVCRPTASAARQTAKSAVQQPPRGCLLVAWSCECGCRVCFAWRTETPRACLVHCP
jgi:hypothetical protein